MAGRLENRLDAHLINIAGHLSGAIGSAVAVIGLPLFRVHNICGWLADRINKDNPKNIETINASYGFAAFPVVHYFLAFVRFLVLSVSWLFWSLYQPFLLIFGGLNWIQWHAGALQPDAGYDPPRDYLTGKQRDKKREDEEVEALVDKVMKLVEEKKVRARYAAQESKVPPPVSSQPDKESEHAKEEK